VINNTVYFLQDGYNLRCYDLETKKTKVTTEKSTAQEFWFSQDKNNIFIYKQRKTRKKSIYTLVGLDEKTHNVFY
jgi:predicted esterase YcpF (UPF0227 family)